MRVAVASSDGKVINQHFGKATQFLVFELNKGSYKFLELRKIKPICGTSDFEGHNENSLNSTIEKISDCRFVLCSRYGIGIKELLRKKDIEIIEAPFNIKDALEVIKREKCPK